MKRRQRELILEKAHKEIQEIASKYNLTIEGSKDCMKPAYLAHHGPGKGMIFKEINVAPF